MSEIHRNFNHDWLFIREDRADFCRADLDDSSWRALNLPHDWSNETLPEEKNPTGTGGGFVQAGIGWYRKHFQYDPEFDGRQVSLLFDGIYMDSRIWLNGELIGGCRYGYSSFSVDLKNALRPGENVLAVRVDNSLQPNSRWYTGSGIYRNVWLDVREPVHIAQWGIYYTVDTLGEPGHDAAMTFRAEISNDQSLPAPAEIVFMLKDADGKEALTARTFTEIGAGERRVVSVHPVLRAPHLWTNRDPYLYTLTTTVLVEGKQTDSEDTPVGIRTAVFDKEKGFLLNGERVKIKGMCLHHDCGLTGAVGYRETWERRLKTLKEMGCNGIRCAHNPPSPEFLDLCDELGFLVMDEAFDEWLLIKGKGSGGDPYGAGLFFEQTHVEILETMLHRDRNHPSIVLWSIGNEIPEQCNETGVKIARELRDICHREDPSRMITSACDCIAAAGGGTLDGFMDALDVVGYNYVDRWRERAETLYDEDRRNYPDRRFIGSENCCAGGDRGAYIPRDNTRPNRYDYHIWTLKHEWLWRYTVSRDFIAGDYLWTGIDYLGESVWPRRGSGSGPIDSAGFPKDTYYYFRSIWNEEARTLHILPHWNWAGDEGEYKQVIVYTNCARVDLQINGKLVASRACGTPYYGASEHWYDSPRINPTTHDLHLTFDVVYEPGELTAVGYDRNGVEVARSVVQTTGEAAKLIAKADRSEICPDQVVHIDLSTLDDQGRDVPTASQPVRCEVVSGNAHLVGMDGGDMYDLSLYSEAERHMYCGRLMAMIMADAPGPVKVRFTAGAMDPVEVDFNVSAAE